MRAMQAETFSGFGGLQQIELPEPLPEKDRALVRVMAAGVTPLDHTILSGGHPRAKPPLVLGNEGAGVIEDAGDLGLAVGSRVNDALARGLIIFWGAGLFSACPAPIAPSSAAAKVSAAAPKSRRRSVSMASCTLILSMTALRD